VNNLIYLFQVAECYERQCVTCCRLLIFICGWEGGLVGLGYYCVFYIIIWLFIIYIIKMWDCLLFFLFTDLSIEQFYKNERSDSKLTTPPPIPFIVHSFLLFPPSPLMLSICSILLISAQHSFFDSLLNLIF